MKRIGNAPNDDNNTAACDATKAVTISDINDRAYSVILLLCNILHVCSFLPSSLMCLHCAFSCSVSKHAQRQSEVPRTVFMLYNYSVYLGSAKNTFDHYDSPLKKYRGYSHFSGPLPETIS